MRHRIDGVHQLVRGLPRPRVFVAEWLDPPFAAGHWVPEMVDLAGGEEVLGRARQRSFPTTWDAVAAAAPQLLVLAPCGFDLERTVREAGSVPAMGARVVAVDGDAAYSRPGPRVAEGVAQLASLLHPDAVEAPRLEMCQLVPG
jgi:iron complex transport system substrate-binding protein